MVVRPQGRPPVVPPFTDTAPGAAPGSGPGACGHVNCFISYVGSSGPRCMRFPSPGTMTVVAFVVFENLLRTLTFVDSLVTRNTLKLMLRGLAWSGP